MRFLLFSLSFLILLTGCSSRGGSTGEAARYARSLCQELAEVESTDELKQREPKIKKIFNSLAQLLIENSRSPGNETLRPIPPELAAELRQQLERIYRMEEGREIMERAQGEALRSLDRALPRGQQKS